MTDRYTAKDAQRAFERLAKALGKQTGPFYLKDEATGKYIPQVGTWKLDYNPIYGGIAIEELASDAGAENRPFGLGSRMTPREFCRTVDFVLTALHIAQTTTGEKEGN